VGAAIAINASVPNTAAEAVIIFESVLIFFPFLQWWTRGTCRPKGNLSIRLYFDKSRQTEQLIWI
jgi:hypothetical protein